MKVEQSVYYSKVKEDHLLILDPLRTRSNTAGLLKFKSTGQNKPVSDLAFLISPASDWNRVLMTSCFILYSPDYSSSTYQKCLRPPAQTPSYSHFTQTSVLQNTAPLY